MRRSDMDAAQHDLYDQVPDPGCKGLCQATCKSPLDMNPRERQRIREHGVDIPDHDEAAARIQAGQDYTCPALVDGACSVYAIRPMICRLAAACELMPCRHGCRPPGGLLGDVTTYELIARSLGVGQPLHVVQQQIDTIRIRLSDPQLRVALQLRVACNRTPVTLNKGRPRRS